MRIVNKNDNAVSFLTVDDLSPGEVFRFKDKAACIYLMTDDCYAIDVETGAICDTDTSEFKYSPVERISCHLVIE